MTDSNMSEVYAAVADPWMRGERLANEALKKLHESPSCLYLAMCSLDGDPIALRGFMRRVQKMLEDR